MATITLKGDSIETIGELPAVGSDAPDFTLTNNSLADVSLADYAGKTVVLNIVPSLDTGICLLSAKRFNQEMGSLTNTAILTVSLDLPFAQGRVCEAEGIDQVETLSCFRAPDFANAYGVGISTGPLAGVLSRAIVVINPAGEIAYTEQVPEITQEPDYDAALAAVQATQA